MSIDSFQTPSTQPISQQLTKPEIVPHNNSTFDTDGWDSVLTLDAKKQPQMMEEPSQDFAQSNPEAIDVLEMEDIDEQMVQGLNRRDSLFDEVLICPEYRPQEQEKAMGFEQFQPYAPVVESELQQSPKQPFNGQDPESDHLVYTQFHSVPQDSLSVEQQEKNDSKNVGKGFMKAFAKHVRRALKKNPAFLCRWLPTHQQRANYMSMLKVRITERKSISLDQIRQLFTNCPFSHVTRTLASGFVKRHFLAHVFNSKMQKRHIHLKYISRWREILRDPYRFNSMKN